MKKKILLLCTFFVSLFVTIIKVKATTMYMDCYVDDRCADADGGIFINWKCMPNLHTFALLTDNDGSIDYYMINSNSDAYLKFENEDYCWLKGNFEDLSNKCNKDNRYEETYDEILNNGYCPIAVRTQYGEKYWINTEGFTEFVPAGKTKNHKVLETIEQAEYRVYKFTDKNGKDRIVAEGYGEDGKYSYLGPDFVKFWSDEILQHQKELIKNLKGDYFKVSTNFNSLMIAGKGLDNDDIAVCPNGEGDCNGFETIIDSNDSNNAIYEAVSMWYDDSAEKLESLKPLLEVANNENLINSCKEINDKAKKGERYSFSNNYPFESLIKDLEKAYNAIEMSYSDDAAFFDYTQDMYGAKAIESATTYIYKFKLGIMEIVDLAEENDPEYYLNKEKIVEAIQRDIKEKLEEFIQNENYKVNIIDASENQKEYAELIYTTVAYLNSNPSAYQLNAEQSDRIKALNDKFAELVKKEELKIFPVVDCKSLLGQDLIDKINSYLNIIKIAVPIMLIGFGIIDFTKAVFAGDEEQMKKAQKDFLKRLGIAILIFLTPTFVNFILQLANKVWTTISPNACGLFES